MWKKRIPPGKGTEIGAMNYAYQESKHGYTCNIDRRNAALRIWSVYVARYRENIRNDATRQYATRLEKEETRREKKTLSTGVFFNDEPITALFVPLT